MERGDTTNHGIDHSSNVSHDRRNPLATSIWKMIHDLPHLSSDCSIYRVPKNLRAANENAYTPKIVSIGPFHHGKENLQDMEEYKLRYLQAFLDRTRLSMERCVEAIKEWEESARNHYAESIKLSSDEFVKMLLLDGSFIIEVIWRYKFSKRDLTDYLNKLIFINDLKVDMILLENQLPFFVLEGLFNLVFIPSPRPCSFLKLSINYFKKLFLVQVTEVTEQSISSFGVKHFIDLLRLCHLPSSLIRSRGSFVTVRNLTELEEAGMKFKKGSSNHILDIKYTMGVLEIPHFQIDGRTESLLRNHIALEQCHHRFDSYIIDYVYLLIHLIDTAKDADLLIQKEIICNYLKDGTSI